MLVLAALADHFTPLFFAALACWILCVCVHEFAHALVAYIGGDASVRDKGYLTLDPTRFIDPVMSLLVPAIVLLMGGMPLPGGSVMIDWTRLKSRQWMRAVYAAGPASNFLLSLLFATVIHPKLGIIDHHAEHLPTWVYFCGAMSFLNLEATIFNLIPLPPFDGFGLIEHRFSPEMQWKMRQPQTAILCLAVVFVLFALEPVRYVFTLMMLNVSNTLGMPFDLMYGGFRLVFANISPE